MHSYDKDMETTGFPADEESIKWYKLFRMGIWVCLLKKKQLKIILSIVWQF